MTRRPSRNVFVLPAQRPPVADQPVEIVERKGIGHPDTICDGVMEQVAVELGQLYQRQFGQMLHFNVDKSLLVAGQSRPRFGGGHVQRPLTLIFGGRATTLFAGERIDVAVVAETAARRWLKANLPNLDVGRHVRLKSSILPGSAELSAIVQRQPITANDTSATVGYAPLTDVERIVLGVERHVNSPAFKRAFPETGEDVKVMGVRRGGTLSLTVAIAFVGRHVPDEAAYFRRKAEVGDALRDFVERDRGNLSEVQLHLNTLDHHGAGEAGVYLTVTGTSAENGDDGQVGRGNGLNGLIPLNRPRTVEAPAGKNPVSHVGKVYSALAQVASRRIVEQVSGVREVYVWLVSQIGAPLEEPQAAWAEVALAPGVDQRGAFAATSDLIEDLLDDVETFTQRLVVGELGFYTGQLRSAAGSS